MILAFLLLIAAAAAFIWTTFRIKKVNITGSERYSYEFLYDYVFEERNDANTILFYLDDKKAGKINLSFVDNIEIEMAFPDTINVTVYDRALSGYVDYRGSNMYFDSEGVVIDSTVNVYDNVPEIVGLSYDHIVLYEKIATDNTRFFDELNIMNQHFTKYELWPDSIVIGSDGTYSFVIGDVTVKIGAFDDHIGSKIYEVKAMKAKFLDSAGVLHMENFTGDESYIIFDEK